MRFRTYLIAILVAVAGVAGTATPTYAGRSTLLESRSYVPAYDASTSEATPGDCPTFEVCESSASADASTGQAACKSDVAATGRFSTIGTVWFEEREILVPFRSVRMSASSTWHLEGTASASGDAVAYASLRLQILDASGALLADSSPHGVLNVHGDGSFGVPADEVNGVRFTGPAVAEVTSSRKAPTKVTLRAILQCEADTGRRPVEGVYLPGSARVEFVTGAEATRLLALDVDFYR